MYSKLTLPKCITYCFCLKCSLALAVSPCAVGSPLAQKIFFPCLVLFPGHVSLCVQTSVCLCFLFQQHHPSQAPFLRDLTKAYKHIEGHVQPARLWSFTLSITMQRAVGRTVILGIYNCISWLMVNHGVMFFHLLVRKIFPFMTSTLQF